MFRAIESTRNIRRHSVIPLAAATFAIGLVIGGSVVALSAIGCDVAAATTAPIPQWAQDVLSVSHPAEVLRVIDGDTFEARVHFWPGLAITTKVRLRDIDAPELRRARCHEERIKAVAACEALSTMLAAGSVGISSVSLGKYGGRVIADASARRTPNVSRALLTARLARRYYGGRRRS